MCMFSTSGRMPPVDDIKRSDHQVVPLCFPIKPEATEISKKLDKLQEYECYLSQCNPYGEELEGLSPCIFSTYLFSYLFTNLTAITLCCCVNVFCLQLPSDSCSIKETFDLIETLSTISRDLP